MLADLQFPILTEPNVERLFSKVFTKRQVTVTAATFAVPNDLSFDETTIILDRATGVTVTLPAASGRGLTLRFLVKTSVSGGSHVIKVANSTDSYVGAIWGSTLAGSGSFMEGAGGGDDTLTMNGGTQGGLAGSVVTFKDELPTFWQVTGLLIGSGTMVSFLTNTV